jgi:acyl-CoA synthetase (AMP-forming)/AMP-acid ligase II
MGKFSKNIMADSFLSCAHYNPKGEIIVSQDRRITWKEFTPRVMKIADALVKLGVKKYENVAFMFHNTIEFIEINCAIHAAGAVPTPMNYRFTPREIEYQGQHCDAKVFLYDSIWSENVDKAAPKLKNIKEFICFGESGIDGVIDYEEFVSSGDESFNGVDNDLKDVAVMIYTGGTTGFPKGVMLTYQGHVDMFAILYANAIIRTLTMDIPIEKYRNTVDSMPIPLGKYLARLFKTNFMQNFFKKESTFEKLHEKLYGVFSDPENAKKSYKKTRKYIYPSMPFFHDAAYANLIMGELMGNMCFVLLPKLSFDPELVLSLVEKEGINNMGNVPTGWKKIVSYPDADKFDLTSLQLATTGGGVCPAKLKSQILRLFPNTMIFDGFGQTEMTPVTSFKLDSDPDKLTDRSVGKSIIDAKIVNDAGNEVPQGESGEILYSSSTVMKGYYKDEEKTSESMEDGWFRSGDLGYIDENGEIRIIDRKKECINTGGEKVFPLEVEEVICEHDNVDDACIIGIPDEEWGNTIRAIVVLKEKDKTKAQEIKDFCRDKVAGYKIPRSIVFVDALPFSPVGKMLRQKIRDQYGQA